MLLWHTLSIGKSLWILLQYFIEQYFLNTWRITNMYLSTGTSFIRLLTSDSCLLTSDSLVWLQTTSHQPLPRAFWPPTSGFCPVQLQWLLAPIWQCMHYTHLIPIRILCYWMHGQRNHHQQHCQTNKQILKTVLSYLFCRLDGWSSWGLLSKY